MSNRQYSAGTIKLPFWFFEFKQTIQLLSEGKNMEAIGQLSMTENLFGAPTTERAKQTFLTVRRRVQGLPSDLYPYFLKTDVSTQKVIALIAIMNTDDLFFDFVYEVYREKLILGEDTLQDSDIRIFFNDKQAQSERVASWTDQTLKRLSTSYKNYLHEAGIALREARALTIRRPVLYADLQNILRLNGMDIFIKALLGVA